MVFEIIRVMMQTWCENRNKKLVMDSNHHPRALLFSTHWHGVKTVHLWSWPRGVCPKACVHKGLTLTWNAANVRHESGPGTRRAALPLSYRAGKYLSKESSSGGIWKMSSTSWVFVRNKFTWSLHHFITTSVSIQRILYPVRPVVNWNSVRVFNEYFVQW